MADPTQGVLDTSVVLELALIDASLLPDESAITAVTLAELAAEPHATENKEERARRQDRLQRDSLVARAERGERITIARDGRPVAELGPTRPPATGPLVPEDDPLFHLDAFAIDGPRTRRSLTNEDIDQALYGDRPD